MSLTRKVAYNTIVQIVGKVITTVSSLILVAALTRHLGVSGYGQYTTIFAYLAFFGVLADFGFFWIYVREIAKPEADVDKITSNILTLRTVIGILFFGLAFAVAFFIPKYAGIRAGIGITAMASLFLALNSTYVGIFQNKLRMDKAVITDVVGRLIILALTLYLIKLNYGLNLILWAYALGNFINLVLSIILGRAYTVWHLTFDFPYWKSLFKTALPMAVILVLGQMFFKVDTVLLSLMKTSTDVGIYGPPYKVLETLILMPAIFLGNVFPIITRYIYNKDDRLQGALQKSFSFLVILAFPIVIGLIFTAEKIIRLVAGQEFVTAHTISPVLGLPATSVTALQILAVGMGLSYISHIFGYLIIALDKQQKMIMPYLYMVIFNLGANLLVIPRYSYIGAAFTTVLTEVLALVFSLYVARKHVDMKLNLKVLWQVLFASAFMGVFMFLTAGQLNLGYTIIASATVYGLALYAVGGINAEMFAMLLPGKKTDAVEEKK